MPTNAQVLVCDAAQVDSNGRLHVLGLGAAVLPLPTPPHTLVVRLFLDPADALRPHEVTLQLLGPDGRPVRVGAPATSAASLGPSSLPNLGALGGQPIELTQQIPALAEDAAELPNWGPIVLPMVFALGPELPIEAGPHRWRLVVDGNTDDRWSETFLALPVEQMAEEG